MRNYKIAVAGTGYVGLSIATLLSQHHKVTAVDIIPEKVDMINNRNNAETVALFAGFLYCGDCGSRLVRRSASYKGKRYIYYQCSGSKQNKGSCTSHNLRDEKLYNIVRNALQMQIQIVMEEAEFVESIEVFNDKRVKIHFTFEDVLAGYAE